MMNYPAWPMDPLDLVRGNALRKAPLTRGEVLTAAARPYSSRPLKREELRFLETAEKRVHPVVIHPFLDEFDLPIATSVDGRVHAAGLLEAAHAILVQHSLRYPEYFSPALPAAAVLEAAVLWLERRCSEPVNSCTWRSRVLVVPGDDEGLVRMTCYLPYYYRRHNDKQVHTLRLPQPDVRRSTLCVHILEDSAGREDAGVPFHLEIIAPEDEPVRAGTTVVVRRVPHAEGTHQLRIARVLRAIGQLCGNPPPKDPKDNCSDVLFLQERETMTTQLGFGERIARSTDPEEAEDLAIACLSKTGGMPTTKHDLCASALLSEDWAWGRGATLQGSEPTLHRRVWTYLSNKGFAPGPPQSARLRDIPSATGWPSSELVPFDLEAYRNSMDTEPGALCSLPPGLMQRNGGFVVRKPLQPGLPLFLRSPQSK